ncbi:MAG: 2-oxoglutarate dehydrogenase E1 component [Rickettsiaceae bacterium H1]|nr:2-oxoglutarate dehydrogenase E1 component [Rickettsiaceae bacterium H1]
MMDLSCLTANNAAFLEELYKKYSENPNSIDKSWVKIFATLERENTEVNGMTKEKRFSVPDNGMHSDVKDLIDEYRTNGHFIADLNPLNRCSREIEHNLENLDEKVNLGGKFGLNKASIRQIIDIMKKAHCETIGLEFMHIRNAEEKEWLQSKLENYDWRGKLSKEERIKIFQDVMEAELFENYLHVKFPGAKRFSVEGAESSIAALENIIGRSTNFGVLEVLIGMAHRGRLNVLTKVLRKKYSAMLYEFQGNVSLPAEYDVSGDVKYHMGYSCDRTLANGKKVHLSLAANPSHLESVNAVLMGKVRCKQDLLRSKKKALGVLIHGDAAFTGQGVVHECFNLNSVKNYDTGGIIHILINNQIGFTTNPIDARGFHYPAYAGVAYEIPIFHINGDDPEAVVYCSTLATEYRYRFSKDSIVGMQCYRRYGHNEGDEPRFTQPKMYGAIGNHKSSMNLYADRLMSEGILTREEMENMQAKFKQHLDRAFEEAKNYRPDSKHHYANLWQDLVKPKVGTKFSLVKGIDKKELKDLAKKLFVIPKEITAHSKVEKLFSSRLIAVERETKIDWGNAEHLAFASLLIKGINIRLAGQDTKRGTFSHRHSAVIDQDTEENYIPLNHLTNSQGNFEVINSTLSEYAAMGFEYGYSLVNPKNLVLWEGQFGDFANGAQIIIDQFIAAAETKWLQSSGLVLLLPHGYEGQGPEHSSARIERFLQLCAEDNMQVVNCSTPANYFHILRRQIYNNFRKPLIVFTPKSLLRHNRAISSLDDLSEKNSFQPVILDERKGVTEVQKLALCSGKIYYDVMEELADKKDIAVIRLEQLYPFPEKEVKKAIDKYKAKEIIWCQEEPKNMGAWSFIHQVFYEILDIKIQYIGRKTAASPASGYLEVHNRELKEIIDKIVF